MNLGQPDSGSIVTPPRLGARAAIKSIVDGALSETALGHFNGVISGIRILGPLACRPIVIGNVPYPFQPEDRREGYGQLNGWSISDVTMDELPGQLSLIYARDAQNTPHTITLTGINIAGTTVLDTNSATYFDVSPFAYGITWDFDPIIVLSAEFVVEDGSGLATANSYASLVFGDTYHSRLDAPVAWSGASTVAKYNALRRASAYIDDMLGGRWRGARTSSTQALAWPRAGVVDADTNDTYLSNVVPLRLQQATAEVALRVLGGVILQPDIATGAGGIVSSSTSVGGISISETFSGAQSTRPRWPIVERKLRGLITSPIGSVMVRMTR